MSENQFRVSDVQVPSRLCGGLNRGGTLAVQCLGHSPERIAGHCVLDGHAEPDAHHEDREHRRHHRDPPGPASVAAAGRVGALRWSWRRRLGRIRRDGSPPGEKHLDELGVRWILSCGRSGFGIEVDRPEPVQELVISRHREHVGGLAELLAAEVIEDATHGGLERPVWLGVLACLEPVVHRRATTPTVVAGLPDQYAPARARGASASAGAVQGVSHCAISLLANPRRDRTPDDPAYPASESDRCHHRYGPRRDVLGEGAATATRPAQAGPCLAAEGGAIPGSVPELSCPG